MQQPRGRRPRPLRSRVIDWNTRKPIPTRTGQRRDVFDAPTGTLDRLHGHITTLNPGENTGPLHRHPQEELVIIKEGTIEVNIDGRKQVLAGPGFGDLLRGERVTKTRPTSARHRPRASSCNGSRHSRRRVEPDRRATLSGGNHDAIHPSRRSPRSWRARVAARLTGLDGS